MQKEGKNDYFLNCLSNYTFFVIGKIPLQKVGKKREQWCQTRIQCLTEYSPLAGLPFPRGGGGEGGQKGGQRGYTKILTMCSAKNTKDLTLLDYVNDRIY